VIDVSIGRCEETTAPCHVREDPVAGNAFRVCLPDVEDPGGLRDPAELEHELGMVGAPPADARLAPPKRRGLPVRFFESQHGRGRVSAPERDEREDGHMLRRVKSELILSQLQSPLRMRTGELKLAAVDGALFGHRGGRIRL
jgi:hypothetical protein